MKLLLLCVAFLAVVSIVFCRGLPSEEEDRPGLGGSVKSYLTEKGFISPRDKPHRISKRQTFNCTNTAQCTPPGIGTVPPDLIDCINGQCDCNECFELSDNGICTEVSCEDWRYDEAGFECEDNRPKQLTAFLLSLFLSFTGAANFYIGRDDLGGGQIFLFIISLIAICAVAFVPLCLFCCMTKDDMRGSIVFIVFMILMLVIIVLIVIIQDIWWLVDLIIFATNQRDAGNGCMLQDNL